jgi:uncharacterized iron-regulated protein
MADELRLDVIVDEHGSAQKLSDVDAGVAKVIERAQVGKGTLDDLGKAFGVNTVNLSAFEAGAAGTASTLSLVSTIAGIAVPVVVALAGAFQSAAEQAKKLTETSDQLGTSATRIQAITQAAAEDGVSFEKMAAGLTKLQERIGSGKLNDELRDLHINIVAFKETDIVGQFTDLSEAIGRIEDPLARATMKARVFGDGAKEMGRLAKEGFKEAVDGATTMSAETIRVLNDAEKQYTDFVSHIKTQSKTLAAEGFGASLGAFKNIRQYIGVDAVEMPDAPKRPGQPERLPTPSDPGPDGASFAQLAEMVKAAADLRKEIVGSAEASVELEGIWTNAAGHIEFVSPIFKTIRDLQYEIAKGAESWGNALDRNVLAKLTSITDRLGSTIVSENLEQSDITRRLNAKNDAPKSEFDRQFNAIDKELKDKIDAASTLPDQGSRNIVQNEALETANLKVQELQANWDLVGQKTDAVTSKTLALGNSYASLAGGGSAGGGFQPGGGTALPGGLVAPTAEQLANHRYFGPVTANGQPDLARMGGAAPGPTTINIHANNSYFDSIDDLVKKVAEGLDERDKNLGVRASR